jgi:hypothetical protein
MAEQKKPNFKYPHSPHHDEQGQPATCYADKFHEYEICYCGTTKTKYRDPTGNKNYDSYAGITGDVEHHDQNDGDPVTTVMHPHASRYFANNTSDHSKSNYEEFNGGIHNHNVTGQGHQTSPSDIVLGASKNRVVCSNNIAHVRAGSNQSAASDNGNHVQTSGGESHNFHSKDVATTYGGAHYEIVKDGDWGVHIQDKNMDVRVEKGKMQLNAAKDDFNLKSGKKIFCEVGKSTITIEKDKITIKSPQVVFEKG